MKIRILSDIHTEFDNPSGSFVIPVHEDDSDTVLVLAGDVGLGKTRATLDGVFEQAQRFREVVMVMGNHEYYGSSIKNGRVKVEDAMYQYDNIRLLENDFLLVEDTVFIGATLWTSFCNRSRSDMADAKQFMNDYRIIRHGPDSEPWLRKLDPEDTAIMHDKSVKYIFDAIKFHKSQGYKVCVVTHMGPSYMSVSPKFRASGLNSSYVTDLEDEITASAPELWIHGHTHESFDYNIGDTRVIVNPRGYFGHEINRHFDPNLSVTI